ncbi:MAG: hypothetical protein JWP29_2311, partial [Rhodoferax sp.]|nr:hypothetical protein [Rhodoferax sp.]
MSYNLEALKRADAERERGAVPTLRSHGTPAATVTTGRPAGRLWIAALAAVVVVLLAALAWTLLRQPAPLAVVAQVPAVVPAPVIAVPPTPAEPPRAATTAP